MFKHIFISTLALVALSASFAHDTVRVQHAQGETFVPFQPEKVFTFDFASAGTLRELGIDIAGIASSSNPAAQAYMNDDTIGIGSLFEPDFELINAEKPDLIIVAARSSRAYEELSKIAPTIDLSFRSGDMWADLQKNTRILGDIFGKEDVAEEKLAALETTINELAPIVQANGDGLAALVTGSNVSLLATENARGGRGQLVYKVLGLEPSLPDVAEATHGEPVSFEFLLETNPKQLFIIDRDAAIGAEDAQPAAQILDNPLVAATDAAKNGNIVYLNPFDWYIIVGAGLDSAERMLGEIAAAYEAE